MQGIITGTKIMRAILLPFFALVATFLSLTAFAQERLDTTPRIAVISAFAPEWLSIRELMTETTSHDVNGSTFVTGKLEGKNVVAFLSGVSMVNAAMTTQQALDRFSITSIVVSGIAGGVDPDLNIGDVVIAGRWAQYLDMVIARETGDDAYSPPPFLDTPHANFGMMFPRIIDVTVTGEEQPVKKFWFDVDAGLLATAQTVAASMDLEACVAENQCLGTPPKIVVGGSGVSGSAFVDNTAFREYVFDTFGAKVLDMETAAVAHVAFNNGVPFIAFRSLSDLAGGSEEANEMGTFMGLAASNSAAVMTALVKAMP